eukprot:3676094-Ditylum_brightwellii.AAC.1
MQMLLKFKPGKKNKAGTLKVHKPVLIVEGTYCTKGQVHVIAQFIESVTDSFQTEQVLKFWPPHGLYHTQVHIIADDCMEDTNEEDVLEYIPLDEIEACFKGKPNTHIYNRQ